MRLRWLWCVVPHAIRASGSQVSLSPCVGCSDVPTCVDVLCVWSFVVCGWLHFAVDLTLRCLCVVWNGCVCSYRSCSLVEAEAQMLDRMHKLVASKLAGDVVCSARLDELQSRAKS